MCFDMWARNSGVQLMNTTTRRCRRLRLFCFATAGGFYPGEYRSTQPLDPPGAARSRRDPKVITILVIEDSDALRQTTADILRSEGYGVTEAVDGIEGLQALREQHIDVLILDLHLPRLDGIGVLEALDDPPVVIVMSAFEYYAHTTMRERFGSQVFEYLQKPVSPERLLEVVAEAASGLPPGG